MSAVNRGVETRATATLPTSALFNGQQLFSTHCMRWYSGRAPIHRAVFAFLADALAKERGTPSPTQQILPRFPPSE